MAKKKSSFVCSNCGYMSLKWMGRCPECGEWNTLMEKDDTDLKREALLSGECTITHIDQVDISEAERISTSCGEFNRILGGGVVKGSYNLLSGHPGVGKSTIMLQTALDFSENHRVLYLSGEESISQVKMRFDRFERNHEPKLYLSNESNLQNLPSLIEKENIEILFIDSIQTVFTPEASGIPGSVSQIKECAVKLLEVSKRKGITTFVVGHVTKSGNIAGPMLLEHMVDTVLLFEGDPTLGYRILRSSKNRFGRTDEIGIFTMTSGGLMEVENPSQFFIGGEEKKDISGSALALVLEGSRPFLIEVQCLATSSNLPQPRRVVTGIDPARLAMVAAILEKRGDVFLSNFDLFVNVVGGIKMKNPASDLPLAASLLSTVFNLAIPRHCGFVGEMGLAGEIRKVPGIELMIREGARLGLKRIYMPVMKDAPKVKGVELVQLSDIYALVEEIRSMNIFE